MMTLQDSNLYEEGRKHTAGLGTPRRYCKRCQQYKYTDKPNEIMLKCPDCNYRIRNKPRTRKVKRKRSRKIF